MSRPVRWTAWEYAFHLVTKYDHPSVVPPCAISGRLTGAGFALTALVCTEAWVVKTAAASTGGSSAGVANSQPAIGQRIAMRRVGTKWGEGRNECSGDSDFPCCSNRG